MGYRLGVDLGTTFTAAAIGNGQPPSMLGLGNRALQIPSVLFLQDDGSFLVGEPAERRGLAEPSRLVREFKRRIGDHVPLLVAGTPYSPQALTARLLSWVVDTSTQQVGGPPNALVLTHPANWGAYKRELLDQVIALADVGEAYTCPEPQAAAVQYAARARLEPGARVVVYDLGGGTFDVCVLEKTDTGFSILGSPEGIEHLGGIDFDEAVFRHVLGSLGSELADVDPESAELRNTLTRLRRDCVDAKEALSADVDTTIPVALPGRSTTVRLTRAELESLIGPSLQDTITATGRALRTADATSEQLTAIVLVGGSSRIPLVSHLLQETFGTRTALDTHPKHDIALGAVQYRADGGSAATATAPPFAGATDAAAPTTTPRRATGPPPTSRLSPQERARRAGVPAAAADPPRTEPAPPRTAEPSRQAEDATDPTAPVGALAPRAPTSPAPPSTPQPGTPRPPRRSPAEWLSDAPPGLKIGLVAAVVAVIVAGLGAVRLTSGSSPDASGNNTEPQSSPTSPGTTGQDTAPHAPGLPSSTRLPRTSMVVRIDAAQGHSDLYVVDAQDPTATPRRLVGGRMNEDLPALSPDRQTIIFKRTPYTPPEDAAPEESGSTTLWAAAADGSQLKRLNYRLDAKTPCTGRPGWSPDARTLAVLCSDGIRESIALVHLTEDRANTELLTEIDPELHPEGVQDITFADDGDRVLFADSADKGGTTGLYYVDVSSGSTSRLTFGLDRDGESSPADPDLLAFRRKNSAGGADVFLMNVAGELIGDCPHERASRERSYTLCRLTDEGDRDAQDPSWSAGGDKIAFKVDADIKVVSVSGGQAKSVLPPTHGVSAPAWSSR